MTSGARADQRRIIMWAIAGMAGVFVVIALVARARGLPWSTAAAIGGLPTIFGGWYFGALLPLSRHDFSDGPAGSAAGEAATSTIASAVPTDDPRRSGEEDLADSDADTRAADPAA